MSKKFRLLFVLCIPMILSISVSGCKKNEQEIAIKPKKIQRQSEQEPELTEEKIIALNTDTSDWLIFRNKKYMYEIKYPKESRYPINVRSNAQEKDGLTKLSANGYMTDLEHNSSISLGWGGSTKLRIEFIENPTTTVLPDYIYQGIDLDNPYDTLTKEKINQTLKIGEFAGFDTFEFILDNESGLCDHVLVDGEDRKGCFSTRDKKIKFIYFEYDKNTIGRVSYQVKSYLEDYSEYHAKLFEAMLSTFKFVD